MLRHELCPPNDGDHAYELTPAGCAHTRVTEQAVARACSSQSVKKAPGPHQLSFGATWQPWKWETERTVRLTRAVIHKGRHPAERKWASGMVNSMHGNDDDTKLKA